MPVLPTPSYRPPFPFTSGHVQTLFPVLFRPVPHVQYMSERISTPDGDFLDLDWVMGGNARLAIVLHGLEGNSRRKYVTGMARVLSRNGFDILAMNFRGCSGDPNDTLRLYHSGETGDLATVIAHALASDSWEELHLIGFSAGGNMVLRYLGENPGGVPWQIRRAAVLSVPVDLEGSVETLSRPSRRMYMRYFLTSLKAKMRVKHRQFPEAVDIEGLEDIDTFEEFDRRYTAPLNGFDGPRDYWRRASSLQVLGDIRVPVLLCNAANDPFLSSSCFPAAVAARSTHLHLEVPSTGGHVGFVRFNTENVYYSELRTLAFLDTGR